MFGVLLVCTCVLAVVELSAKPVTALVWTMRLREKYWDGGVGQRMYMEGLSVMLAMAAKGACTAGCLSFSPYGSVCCACSEVTKNIIFFFNGSKT